MSCLLMLLLLAKQMMIIDSHGRLGMHLSMIKSISIDAVHVTVMMLNVSRGCCCCGRGIMILLVVVMRLGRSNRRYSDSLRLFMASMMFFSVDLLMFT